ncbi:MAG: hypothetical protein QOG38_3553 [Hyphomicrobiales bacterium]|jgi:hypothetical protein|nr:hypothetical protein [Hyphomicrobiales bacterium]
MMSELEAILGGDLVTMVFLYGSAAMLIVSMIVVTWLCETRRSRGAVRVGQAAFLKAAPHRD